MHVRPARLEDAEALFQLELRAFSGDRFKRRQLRYLLTRANAFSLVVEVRAQAAGQAGPPLPLGYGILLFRRGSAQARLYSLCVDPAARGRGLGPQLLTQLMDEARSRGCQWLSLEVRADNQPALSMYERHGFVSTDWLSDYYEDGCTAWRMVCCLAQSDTPPLC
jgi:ribosomal protein S18 acetylase RimI-like enzyme